MSATTSYTGHSADVQMHLAVNGRVLPVREVGPGFVIVDHSIDSPPAEAELFVSIDGEPLRRTVWLSNGLKATDREITISPLPDATLLANKLPA